jgi:small subunit ribosomal protein S21
MSYESNKKIKGTAVFVKDGEFIDKALRKFKNKVSDAKILETLREKEFYTKPTTQKKKLKSAAKARWKKYLSEQQLPKKMY